MAKFYITMYEEYPIYEPAEGGYYYAGRTVVPLEDNEYNSVGRAVYEAEAFVRELIDGGDDWIGIGMDADEFEQELERRGREYGEDHARVMYAYKPSVLIGEGAEIYIETPAAYQKGVSGWHPYE